MKTLAITFALFITTSSFAGINPHEQLELGRQAYAASSALIVSSFANIKNGSAEIEDLARRLEDRHTEGPALNAVYKACAPKLRKDNELISNRWNHNYLVSEAELNQQLKSLETAVAKYISAEQCGGCDPDVRNETLLKYEKNILETVKRLSSVGETSQAYYTEIISNHISCDFSPLFKIIDSKKFKDLPQDFTDYSAGLNVNKLMSGEFDLTLNYLSKNSVALVREAASFGKGKYSFNRNVVTITVGYSYMPLFGYTDVFHPKKTNPLVIINDSLK